MFVANKVKPVTREMDLKSYGDSLRNVHSPYRGHAPIQFVNSGNSTSSVEQSVSATLQALLENQDIDTLESIGSSPPATKQDEQLLRSVQAASPSNWHP